MTEEPRITNTQKEKDPRKVAAGKKLGEISKMAKNQKQRLANERSESSNEDASDLKNNNAFFYVGFAAVVVVGYLGIQYFTKKSQDAPDAPNAPVVPRCVSEAPKFQQSNLISLDD